MSPFAAPSVRAAAALLLAVPAALAQQPLPADRAAGAATVTVDQCKKWLGTLASPEFEGRGTGYAGFQKAADFVAAQFKALGLEARGDDGTYFQTLGWKAMNVVPDKTSLTFSAGDQKLVVPVARLSGNASAAMSASGDVVLLVVTAPPSPRTAERGAAFEAPQVAGLDTIGDVNGKVVVVFVRTSADTRANLPFVKLAVRRELQDKGTAAVLYAQEQPATGLGSSISGPTGGNRAAGGRRAPLDATFGGDDLTKLLAMAGKDAAVLAGGDKAALVPLPVHAAVEVAVTEGPAPAMNVWGVLPGSDPQKKDEYVVIGSHLDHLGRRGDTYFPGADDDGSGTTGVLAVSQMFAKNKTRPARSILFVCFCGEEIGLQGSRYFAGNCPIPLPSIVSELQMDMIGRDEEEAMDGTRRVNIGEKAEDNRNSLHLVGTQRLAPSLHELCMQRNELAKFDLEFDQESMYGRSDHYNFAQRGVPIAFFFTGLHADYHQLTDTPDKIHYEKLLRVATYVYDIAFELASQPGRPAVDPDLLKKETSGGGRRRPQQPTQPAQPDKKEEKK